MSILGIDIGTTTITALLLNEKNGTVIDKATLKNNSFISNEFHFARLQDPETILDIVIEAVTEIYEELGFFSAAIKEEKILENCQSTTGDKSDSLVKIVIEGDLK